MPIRTEIRDESRNGTAVSEGAGVSLLSTRYACSVPYAGQSNYY